MKTLRHLILFAAAAAFPFHASAGTLFYVPVPAAGSDAKAGIDSANVYTSAVDAGNAKASGRTVNGVNFGSLSAGSGNVVTANGVTLSAATGTLINGGGKADSIQADGAMSDLLSGMVFNDGADDGSEQYIVLDPATLSVGNTYDLRVYVCNSSGQNRQVNLSFVGDGKPAVSTGFFNEDDATTSTGGFAEPNQVYFINYRFTWDGVNTPGVTVTQKSGSIPFCLYALTNHEIGGKGAHPEGAVLAEQPDAIGESPGADGTAASDDIGVSSEVFDNDESLRRHGHWVSVGNYRRCWQPSDVDADWQPYTHGHWVYSRYDGWVWVSDEDFGWATYHYGRWFRVDGSGWFWVPGRVWAPSWVSWRYGHGHVGWAPLPPSALALAGLGISAWADHRWGMGPQAYNFVNVRNFGAPSMAKVLLPSPQNAAIMANTNNITNIVNGKKGVFSGGPNLQAINNAIGKSGGAPVSTVTLKHTIGGKPATSLTAGVLAVSAPVVSAAKKPASLSPVTAVIKTPKIDKGWNGVKDANLAASLKMKIASETPGTLAKAAPATLPGATPKPGKQLKSANTTLIKPGQPVNPVSHTTENESPLPKDRLALGQPVKPTTDLVKKPGKTPKSGTVPATDHPVNPVADIVKKPASTPIPKPKPVKEMIEKPRPTPKPVAKIKPKPTPAPARTPAPAPPKPAAIPAKNSGKPTPTPRP
jgi:hypothetical protein